MSLRQERYLNIYYKKLKKMELLNFIGEHWFVLIISLAAVVLVIFGIIISLKKGINDNKYIEETYSPFVGARGFIKNGETGILGEDKQSLANLPDCEVFYLMHEPVNCPTYLPIKITGFRFDEHCKGEVRAEFVFCEGKDFEFELAYMGNEYAVLVSKDLGEYLVKPEKLKGCNLGDRVTLNLGVILQAGIFHDFIFEVVEK